jgi:hypothetical protein
MGVDRVSPRAPALAPGLAKLPAQGAPGFADLLATAAAPAAGAAPAATPAALVYDAADRQAASDRQARRHGRAMLQALGALQLAMLGGGEDAARAQLAGLAAEAPAAHDPVLRLILREISLRAAVELARGGI